MTSIAVEPSVPAAPDTPRRVSTPPWRRLLFLLVLLVTAFGPQMLATGRAITEGSATTYLLVVPLLGILMAVGGSGMPRGVIDNESDWIVAGLIAGGCDAILVETCQDPLQIKAAVNGAKRARIEAKKDIPIIVQVTVETTGTLLVGADIAAAATVINGNTVTINGTLFTAVTGAPAANQFDRTPGTDITTATNLVAAINLVGNWIGTPPVTASNVGGTSAVVTITAASTCAATVASLAGLAVP